MTERNECSIEGCTSSVHGRSWCSKHYQRWQRYGDPLGGGERFSTSAESFAARTERVGDCLEWTGTRNEEGYGFLRHGGKVTPAHRYAWEQSNGPIPTGMQIDHRCRNHSCCRVEHLRLATNKQNHEHRDVSILNTSGYRGVHWRKDTEKWVARVKHNGKRIIVGQFDDVHEAGEAARAARNEIFTHNDLDRKAS